MIIFRILRYLWRCLALPFAGLGTKPLRDEFRRNGKARDLIEGLIKAGAMKRGDHPSEGIQSQGKVSLLRRMVFVAYTLRHEDPVWLPVHVMIPVAATAPLRPLKFPPGYQWGPPWKWQAFINAVLDEARDECIEREKDEDQFWPRLKA